MKLSNKLIASFSCLIILLLIMSGLSWHAVTEFTRQKDFLAKTEDLFMVWAVLLTKSVKLTMLLAL